jgi:DNA helicase-2/ATP-dependent DNA helicase PcrA
VGVVKMGSQAKAGTEVPVLEGDAKSAVEHRGSHLQIIAAAGSGKTEVVSQRVASLLAGGVDPRGIVAFTFTERAAAELKDRIASRALDLVGQGISDKLGGLYVGTIHAYCYRLLQQYAPRYETYDVLDDNKLTAFLTREANRLELRQLDPRGKLFAAIVRFRKDVDVLENELLDPADMPSPFRDVLASYYDTMERYRLLTYGQQIARAVSELEDPEIASNVHADLRHLIVDEYQDVNPAQERLIELLAGPAVEVCVVGDDDQAIYQWRGSDVANIVEFQHRYPDVATFEISRNRRSRPGIIGAANGFATTIEGRLPKTMGTYRRGLEGVSDVVLWSEHTESDEALCITTFIQDLHDAGVPFRDMAILVRGSVAYPKLLEALDRADIPVQPGGRTGLFQQPEARVLGRMICWMTDIDWRENFKNLGEVKREDLKQELVETFGLDSRQLRRAWGEAKRWRLKSSDEDRKGADLVGELYELLGCLGVADWDLTDSRDLNRLGTLARFTALLADYEAVRGRSRPDSGAPGEQVGGEFGPWYYKNLAIHISNYAAGDFDGFDGEDGLDLDAVDLTTVHGSKGLEWPVVFVPGLSSNRFPSRKSGSKQKWLVPREMFAADRYEGGDIDERRLFYVAMTRARDFLMVSRHETPGRNIYPPSRYYSELAEFEVDVDDVSLPKIDTRNAPDSQSMSLSFSELAAFVDCGMAYRLRNLVGFQPRRAVELGFGKAVHHMMRTVAEHTRKKGKIPGSKKIDRIFDDGFFLPTANKAAHREMKKSGRRLVDDYVEHHAEDLYRVWQTERPFELRLDGITIVGRADVVLDFEDGVESSLAIVDYKTSTDIRPSEGTSAYDLQLQVYADAGRREGLDVRGAYVHDLKNAHIGRQSVDVSKDAVVEAEVIVMGAAERLRLRDFSPTPGDRCKRCEVRTVCASRA